MPGGNIELAVIIGAAIIVALFVLLVLTVVLALRAVLVALKQVTELAMADQRHKSEVMAQKREEREGRYLLEHMKTRIKDLQRVEKMMERERAMLSRQAQEAGRDGDESPLDYSQVEVHEEDALDFAAAGRHSRGLS